MIRSYSKDEGSPLYLSLLLLITNSYFITLHTYNFPVTLNQVLSETMLATPDAWDQNCCTPWYESR